METEMKLRARWCAMRFKVLGLACSPRRQGNTAQLLSWAMAAVRVTGHEAESLFLTDYVLQPCQACGACQRTGSCVLRDDMGILKERLLAADRLVVAAPVFFMGLNAQTKILIDRLQPFWAMKYVLKQPVITENGRPRRRGMFLSAAGTKLPDVFTCAQRTMRLCFKMLEVEYAEECIYRGVDGVGEIIAHPTAQHEVEEAVSRLLE